jgi:aminoglycoside/choline kinase family phosphotransferase
MIAELVKASIAVAELAREAAIALLTLGRKQPAVPQCATCDDEELAYDAELLRRAGVVLSRWHLNRALVNELNARAKQLDPNTG